MNLITESSVEHAVLDLSVNPLDNQQAFSTSTSAVFLHSIITSVGKKHLMNRSVLVPNSTATCHAFFLKVLYLGTADGNLICYDLQGAPLEDFKGNCAHTTPFPCFSELAALSVSQMSGSPCSRGYEV